MYVRVLGFKEGAATTLYNDQQITDTDRLRELDDPAIKELCRQIGKEGHLVSMILQNHLKLLVFWAKHMQPTSRGLDDLSEVNYDKDIKHLQAQKTFEDGLDDSKEPDAPKMTLTPATAAASFTQMKTHLTKCRGTTGLPLKYVVRPQLKGPYDAPKDEPEDPPPFGDPDSPYVTIDTELIARAPILRIDLSHGQLTLHWIISRNMDHLTQALSRTWPRYMTSSTQPGELLNHGPTRALLPRRPRMVTKRLGFSMPISWAARNRHHDQTPVAPV